MGIFFYVFIVLNIVRVLQLSLIFLIGYFGWTEGIRCLDFELKYGKRRDGNVSYSYLKVGLRIKYGDALLQESFSRWGILEVFLEDTVFYRISFWVFCYVICGIWYVQ